MIAYISASAISLIGRKAFLNRSCCFSVAPTITPRKLTAEPDSVSNPVVTVVESKISSQEKLIANLRRQLKAKDVTINSLKTNVAAMKKSNAETEDVRRELVKVQAENTDLRKEVNQSSGAFHETKRLREVLVAKIKLEKGDGNLSEEAESTLATMDLVGLLHKYDDLKNPNPRSDSYFEEINALKRKLTKAEAAKDNMKRMKQKKEKEADQLREIAAMSSQMLKSAQNKQEANDKLVTEKSGLIADLSDAKNKIRLQQEIRQSIEKQLESIAGRLDIKVEDVANDSPIAVIPVIKEKIEKILETSRNAAVVDQSKDVDTFDQRINALVQDDLQNLE